MSQTTATISLSVARVGSGGNTNQGEYFYSFNPANLLVFEPDTKVVFELSPETVDSFEIWRVVSSDNSDQLKGFERAASKRSISFNNANTVEQLISLTVLVIDHANDAAIVNCDPQMTNVPTGGVG